MHEWAAVGVVTKGNLITVDGLNPWDFEWRSVQEEAVEILHPTDPHQRRRMLVYEVTSAGRNVRFAAGELSANVWGFYAPAG
jgi:hypothetical protein